MPHLVYPETVMSFLDSIEKKIGNAISPRHSRPKGPSVPHTGHPVYPSAPLPGNLENFAKVSTALWRAQQPTADGFALAKRMGAKTVIDLRGMHDDKPLLREAQQRYPGTSWRYYRIREWAWHPEDEDSLKVLKVIGDHHNWPVLVHCQHGADRTGTTVAMYRMVYQGWTNAEAMAELPRFGFHSIWFDITWYLKHFDADKVRAQLPKITEPDLELIHRS
jgi:protein tyrosine phosphatase (PTP) superfamily phosphohydrolase (DUF442 family)